MLAKHYFLLGSHRNVKQRGHEYIIKHECLKRQNGNVGLFSSYYTARKLQETHKNQSEW